MASIHRRNKIYAKRHKWCESRFGKKIRLRMWVAQGILIATAAAGSSRIQQIKATSFSGRAVSGVGGGDVAAFVNDDDALLEASKLIRSENKKLFEIGKKAAIAKAMIESIQSIMSAAERLNEVSKGR